MLSRSISQYVALCVWYELWILLKTASCSYDTREVLKVKVDSSVAAVYQISDRSIAEECPMMIMSTCM